MRHGERLSFHRPSFLLATSSTPKAISSACLNKKSSILRLLKVPHSLHLTKAVSLDGCLFSNLGAVTASLGAVAAC